MNVNCIVSRTIRLAEPTKKITLHEPLAYNNQFAHAMQVAVVDDDKQPVELTGVSVVGTFLNNDGVTVDPIVGTVDGNVASVLLPPGCYVCPGWYCFTMNLVSGGASRTVLWVEGMVERNVSGNISDPGTPVGNIEQAVVNANNAAEAAEEAAEAANASAQDITDTKILLSADKTASGNPIVLNDARNVPLKSTKITVNPVHCLHGYSKPWIGGSGKNKLEITAESSGIFTVKKDDDNNVQSISVYGNPTETVRFGNDFYVEAGSYILSGCPANGSLSTYNLSIRSGNLSGTVVGDFDIGSGAEITIPSDGTYYFVIVVNATESNISKTFKPMLRLATETNSVFQPYSNVCHFGPSNTAEVMITKKNILNYANPDFPGKLVDFGDGTLSDSNAYNTFKIPVYDGQSLCVSIYDNEPNRSIMWVSYAIFDVNMQYVTGGGGGVVAGMVIGGGSLPNTPRYKDIVIHPWVNGYAYLSVIKSNVDNVQIEYGSARTDYVEYDGSKQSFDISEEHGSNVYGATITINEDGSATLVVDRYLSHPSASDITDVSDSHFRYNYAPTPEIKMANGSLVPTHALTMVSNLMGTATQEQYSQRSTLHEDFCYSEYYSGKIGWNTKKEYASVADMMSDFNGLEFVYYLKTPISYTLTSEVIQLFSNNQTLYSNPGNNLNIIYRANGIRAGAVSLSETQLKLMIDILNTTPVITEQPEPASGDSGETVTFSVTAENVVSYLWQRSTDSSRYEWVDTDGTESSYDYTLPFGTGWIYFRCRLTGQNGLIVYTDEVSCRYY